MNFLANLRIRSRLLLLLAFTGIALLGLGAFSIVTIDSGSAQATAFIDAEFESVRALSDVRSAVGNARRYEKDLFLNMGDEKETERYTKSWTEEVARIRTAIENAKKVTHPTEAALLQSMQKGIDNYEKGFKDVMGRLTRGEINDPWAANAAMTPLKTDIRQADKSLAELTESVQKRAVERRAQFASTAQRAPWVIAVATTLVALAAAGLALAIVRSILGPIGQLQGVTRHWGQGDLSRKLRITGSDEISAVNRDLNSMHSALVRLVQQVRSGVQVVGANTSEIAAANNDLSERTEQAAMSLQKTNASVQQLSVAVKHSAESASQAVQSAGGAMQVATKGGEVVERVVTTMSEINTSSQKIADIISVIDGIAFQTNILALNAAVEAARAGEQGRGFAVVASEVRSLAGRSAEAAREIKTIIVSSVEKVEEGTALVADAGRTMRDIVDSVGQVATVIEQIRVAANEQHEGIELISTAMDGIDQATQQNAAMVEESAAGAMSLSDEVNHLQSAVSVFNLGDMQAENTAPAHMLSA